MKKQEKEKENKKIKNARKTDFQGIEFKSALERTIYNTLISQGILPDYEGVTYTLSDPLKPTKPFYIRTHIKGFHFEMRPIQKITYTPDFTFKLNDIFVIIEVKGFENDVFPLKRNLFRKHIEKLDEPIMYFEIKSKKELLQALDIVKMETKELTSIRNLIPKLPDKEYPIAIKLLGERDFVSLEEVVNRTIAKIERDRKKDESMQKYADIDLASLYNLVTNISMITIHEDLKGY